MTGAVTSNRASGGLRFWPALAALILLLLSLSLFWPGVAMFDTVRQYGQVLTGHYDDWHPPAMARLWSVLAPLGYGTAPMFTLQLVGYWLGLGLLAQALRGWKALCVLAIGASPLFLGWQIVVLKDGQMAGALASAVGVVAFFRLSGRRVPWPALGFAALCLLYATLLRANAVFSTIPLAVLIFGPNGQWRLKTGLILAGIPLAILATQIANHTVLGAKDSGVSRVEAVYDLAGIAVRTGDADATGLTSAQIAALSAGHCVKALFWDPMLARDDCIVQVQALQHQPSGQLYTQLVRAILRHPLAYAAHRIAHLNATMRWLVPFHWPLAAPPAGAEPNDIGLTSPACCATLRWQISAGKWVETPLGWPILWIAAGLWGLAAARTAQPGAARDLAVALIVSTLCQEASFALLSISSDLRYHLWAMLAVALAGILLWEARPRRRPWRAALAALALIMLSGFAARLALPPTPHNYSELLY